MFIRNRVSWSLAMLALMSTGSLLQGCKSEGNGGGGDAGVAAINVYPTTGQTTEQAGAGHTATFAVILATKPTADVTIGISSSDTSEGTVAVQSLTFTDVNWASPQTVTVTGVDDDESDGDVTYMIVTSPAVSTDPSYSGVNPADVTMTNVDNDSAGVRATDTANLRTTEAGGTAKFKVVLNTKPMANVTVPISSSDVGEVTVSPASLTFTPDNWSSAQEVTLTGVNDTDIDGNVEVTISSGGATSTDTRYNGKKFDDVKVTNVDDDTAGFTITPLTGLTTSESGGTATFTVKLIMAPTADVSLHMVADKPTEVAIDKPTLVFTADNWNSAQTVTLTGQDDTVPDGNQTFTITTEPATSTDAKYSNLNPPDVTGINLDNELPAVQVSADLPLRTTESGGTATFAVVLTTMPSANVTIGISSDKPNEIMPSVTSVTFTSANWNSPKLITLTGQDDDLTDGDQDVVITIGKPTSDDTQYAALEAQTLTATNTDNDVAGIEAIFDNSPKQTTEEHGQFRFWVRLMKVPAGNVTFPVTVSNPAEGLPITTTLALTPANAHSLTQVIVEGVDDNVKDGDATYSVIIGPPSATDDPAYAAVQYSLELKNVDNDTPGISLIPDLVGNNPTLVTSENGQLHARFRIALATRPTAPVTIPVMSNNTREGTIPVTQVTIQPNAWNAVNWIDITSVDDAPDNVADGNVEYRIETGMSTSDDPNYNLPGSFIRVINRDDDVAAYIVTSQTDPLITVEDGRDPQWIRIRLQTEPTGNVIVPVTVTRPGEAMVSQTMLQFDRANWPITQEILVTGLPDATQDGRQDYEVRFGPAMGEDSVYNALPYVAVGAQNIDIDSPDIVAFPTTGLQTDEAGTTTASFGIFLTKAPLSDVTIPVTVLPTAAIGDIPERYEGAILSPPEVMHTASLTFTPTNYTAPQYIFVGGINDDLADGPQSYSLRIGPATSGDPDYGGRSIPRINIVNNDDDTADLVVTPVGPFVNGEPDRLEVTEGNGTAATFKIRLASQPTTAVTVSITSGDVTEAAGPMNGMTPIVYTFIPSGVNDPLNHTYLWNNLNVVVPVSSVDDSVIDGPIDFNITVSSTSSTDSNYQSISKTVKVRTVDDDSARLVVTAAPSLDVIEGGLTPAQFIVALSSIPTDTVYVPIISNDITEGVLSAPGSTPLAGMLPTQGGITVPITPADWMGVTVTLTAVTDQIDDGDQGYQILLGPTASTDGNYVGLSEGPLQATTEDTDTAGFSTSPISPPGPVNPVEGAQTYSFQMRLQTKPVADVTLPVTVTAGADQVSVSPGSLVFTDQNWNDPSVHEVTIVATDDAIADGPLPYTITFGPVSSADTVYGNVTVPLPISGLALDDDLAGIAAELRGFGGATVGSLALFEEGTTQEIALTLGSMPTAPVSITVTVTGRATVEPSVPMFPTISTVTFMPSEWEMEKIVTVRGQSNSAPDAPNDGSGTTAVVVDIDLPVSTDMTYSALTVTPDQFMGSVFDTPRTCLSARTLWSSDPMHPGQVSGVYWIDTDLDGPVAAERVYCDQTTAGGGWTLLAYAGDTVNGGGVPYPGQPGATKCPSATVPSVMMPACANSQGIGVSQAALPGLLAVSTDFGQGQNTLNGVLRNPYAELGMYDFAGFYSYSTLGGLTLSYAPVATCTPLTTGSYTDINGTTNVGTVNLAQALRSPLPGNDYTDISKSYTYSVGTPGAACAVSGNAPVSYLGTWQTPQYGPQALGADGSFVLYVR